MTDVLKGPWRAASRPSSVVGWPVVGPSGRSVCSISWRPKTELLGDTDIEYNKFMAECHGIVRLIENAPAMRDALRLVRSRCSPESELYRIVSPVLEALDK